MKQVHKLSVLNQRDQYHHPFHQLLPVLHEENYDNVTIKKALSLNTGVKSGSQASLQWHLNNKGHLTSKEIYFAK